MEYFTKTQACQMIGTTMPTLNKCIKKLTEQGHNLTVTRDPYNPHLAYLSADQVEVIRQFIHGYQARMGKVALPAPVKRPELPPASSDLPHRPSQGHSEGHRPSRKYSNKPPLPNGWISFEEAWDMTGIAGNWEKSQVDKSLWATPGPFLRNRSTILWALSPKQQEEFFARYGRG